MSLHSSCMEKEGLRAHYAGKPSLRFGVALFVQGALANADGLVPVRFAGGLTDYGLVVFWLLRKRLVPRIANSGHPPPQPRTQRRRGSDGKHLARPSISFDLSCSFLGPPSHARGKGLQGHNKRPCHDRGQTFTHDLERWGTAGWLVD